MAGGEGTRTGIVRAGGRLSDPGFSRYHDPRSTLPIAHIRAAVEEFCRTGTGARPECVHWVHGEQ
jgi:hypothetical protein